MIATHRNVKSGTEVSYLREYAGRAEFREGGKVRRVSSERFIRDYERISEDQPVTLTMPQIMPAPNYGPRKVDELALARQRLKVRGSRRNALTKIDRDKMALVGEIPFCCRCGKSNALQVAHAPAGLFGKGLNIKSNGALVTRLCSVAADSCHTIIDNHVIPDWREEWMRAFCRSEAWIHENKKAAA